MLMISDFFIVHMDWRCPTLISAQFSWNYFIENKVRGGNYVRGQILTRRKQLNLAILLYPSCFQKWRKNNPKEVSKVARTALVKMNFFAGVFLLNLGKLTSWRLVLPHILFTHKNIYISLYSLPTHKPITTK